MNFFNWAWTPNYLESPKKLEKKVEEKEKDPTNHNKDKADIDKDQPTQKGRRSRRGRKDNRGYNSRWNKNQTQPENFEDSKTNNWGEIFEKNLTRAETFNKVDISGWGETLEEKQTTEEIKPSKKNNTIKNGEGEAFNKQNETLQIKLDKTKGISELYKKYKKDENSKKNINTTNKAYKNINKIKVFLIAKSVKIDNKEVMVAIPINNFDDLSNSIYGKGLSARAGTFQMLTEQDLTNKGSAQSTPGNRPFRLEYTLESEGPYNGIPEIPLDTLILPNEAGVEHLSDEEKDLLARSKWRIQSELVRDENGKEVMYQFLVTEYEYDYLFMDNTIFTNVEPYFTDPRDRNSYNRTFKEQLGNFKNIDFDSFWHSKEKGRLLLGAEETFEQKIEELLYKNTDELLNKNIIPVFSNLEDAQDLLITVIEEILEPYKSLKIIKEKKNLLPRTIESIDESFSFKDDRLKAPETRIEKFKDWLFKYRLIKSNTITKAEHYGNYPPQIKDILPDTEMKMYGDFDYWSEESIDKSAKHIPDDIIPDYTTFDVTDLRYQPEFDQVLLNIFPETKIVSIGLGDFFDFWNNDEIKNGEVLFIPSSKKLEKSQLPLLSKKSIDRFYEYQQKFRKNNKPNIDDYIYEIKSSTPQNFE